MRKVRGGEEDQVGVEGEGRANHCEWKAEKGKMGWEREGRHECS